MDLDPFLPARTRAAPAPAPRRRRALSISPPAPTRDPRLATHRAGAGAARQEVRALLELHGSGAAHPGSWPCAGPGRAWLRGPRARNARLGSRGGGGGAGASGVWTRQAAGARAPAPLQRGKGGKNFLPPGCMPRGCPEPGSRRWGMLEACVTPGPGQPPGWARQSAPLSRPPPRRGPGQGRLGARRRHRGPDPGAAGRPALWEGASLRAARLFPAPSRPHPAVGDPVSLLIPSNFRGRGARNPWGGDPHSFVVTRPPLPQHLVGAAVFGDAERRAHADGEAAVSGREGLFVCGIDSVDAHPDCAGGDGVAEGSPPGLRGLERAEGCLRSIPARVRARGSPHPGRPRGRGALPWRPESRTESPARSGVDPGQLPGQVGCAPAGKAGTRCRLPPRSQRRGWGQSRVSRMPGSSG